MFSACFHTVILFEYKPCLTNLQINRFIHDCTRGRRYCSFINIGVMWGLERNIIRLCPRLWSIGFTIIVEPTDCLQIRIICSCAQHVTLVRDPICKCFVRQELRRSLRFISSSGLHATALHIQRDQSVEEYFRLHH